MVPGRSLGDEIHARKPFASPAVEAVLNIARTGQVVADEVAALLDPSGLSQPQYNVLRILRGAGDEGLPCLQVRERMVARVPDVTRILDRLEAKSLVFRTRDSTDRRVVRARISATGLELLARLDRPIEALHAYQMAALSAEQLAVLNDLLVRARQRPEDEGATTPHAK